MVDDKEKSALKQLKNVSENAYEEQEKFLLDLLSKNKETEYGRKYSFSDISSVKDYVCKVPLTVYDDYDSYIDRMIKGEKNILSADDTVFYNISAGSTGTPKYIPIIEQDILKQHLYEDEAVKEIISEEISHENNDELFGKIFNLGENYLTQMADGTLNGVRSGAYFRFVEANGGFDVSSLTASHEVFFPDEYEDMLYVKVRFAMADENVTAIHGLFVNRAVIIFGFIEKKMEQLIYDIKTGTVSECFNVNDRWKRYLSEHVKPCPERAEYLQSVYDRDFSDGMLKKIWPKLRYIRIITGEQFYPYNRKLKKYAKNISVHSFAYSSSESNIGISFSCSRPDEYVLLADTCFYEFIPEESFGDDSQVITIDKVRTGKKYEIIITTLSGLYRYRIGDVVEVTGRYGKAPVVKVCYRKNLVLSLTDERMNVSQFESVMIGFLTFYGISPEGYCVSGDYDDVVPRYVVYIETDFEFDDNASFLMDRLLRENSLGYDSARNMGEIGYPVISPVSEGTFAEFERQYRTSGRRTEQSKPLRLLTKKPESDFFKNHSLFSKYCKI